MALRPQDPGSLANRPNKFDLGGGYIAVLLEIMESIIASLKEMLLLR